jgi:putative heme-binding domain-containing protein
MPWAPKARVDVPAFAAADAPELKGGNWARGRHLFFSELALCSKCHSIHGEGSAIGPDLSNLPHRDYHSVLRDIAEPSFAINPDYISQRIVLKDGRVVIRSVRTKGDKLLIGDDKGQETQIRRDEIEEMAPIGTSIMPEGVPKLLGPDRLRDLLTFRAGYPPWRFTRVADDTWRGTAGMNDGEALTVRRDADGRPAALDIATFLFAREPGRD